MHIGCLGTELIESKRTHNKGFCVSFPASVQWPRDLTYRLDHCPRILATLPLVLASLTMKEPIPESWDDEDCLGACRSSRSLRLHAIKAGLLYSLATAELYRAVLKKGQ
eukprot:3434484-Amphidinium_carterae.1